MKAWLLIYCLINPTTGNLNFQVGPYFPTEESCTELALKNLDNHISDDIPIEHINFYCVETNKDFESE